MKNQFETLQSWIGQILNEIKKDIKTDHLPSDSLFYKANFGSRPLNRLSSDEIFKVYEKELLKGNETLAEWVVNRWVFKHGDIYRHFSEGLSRIHPDFDEIKTLTVEQSEEILKGASFDAVPIYLFSMLNGVVFPETILGRLRKNAETEAASQKQEEASAAEKQTLEQTVARYERDIARLHEKYESRLAGVQKKYTTDVEALKKQIRILQQRLHGNS